MKQNRKQGLALLLAILLAFGCSLFAAGASSALETKGSEALRHTLQTMGDSSVSMLLWLDYSDEKLQLPDEAFVDFRNSVEAVQALREAAASEGKEQYQKKNEAFARAFLSEAQVQYISPHSPILTITANASQISAIAENPLVAAIELAPVSSEITSQPASAETEPTPAEPGEESSDHAGTGAITDPGEEAPESPSQPASAETEPTPAEPSTASSENAGFGAMADIGEEAPVCMIRNEFYKIYADALLDEAHQANRKAQQSGEKLIFSTDEKIDPALLSQMRGGDGLYYLTVTLDLPEPYSEQANREALDRLTGIEETLYTGASSPCALVSVRGGANIDSLFAADSVAYVTLGFTGIAETVAAIPEATPYTFSPTTADARHILRYAVGLGAPDFALRSDAKKFFFGADTNLDGAIRTEDARQALRIAIGLAEGNTFTVSTDSFWER